MLRALLLLSGCQAKQGGQGCEDSRQFLQNVKTHVFSLLLKMNSLYQISSKMLHSTIVIILVGKKEKKRGGLAGI